MNLGERALRGVAWSAVRNWGSRLISFGVFIVLARMLDTTAFGLVSLAGAYIAFVRVFVDQGFADAIIQRDDLDDAHLDTAFWVNLGLSVVFMGASIAAAPWIAALFGEPTLAPVVRWLSPSFVLAALAGVQQALFQRDLDYQTLAVRELIAALVGGGIGVAMAWNGYGVYSLVGMLLGERTAAVVVLWAASTWRPGFDARAKHFRDLFSFGINIVGSNLLNYVNTRADNLIIGYALGAEALGFYEIAYQLFQSGTIVITQTVSSVAFAAFSRMQADIEQMRKSFYAATQTMSVIAFPMFLGAAAVAPELIGTFFGAKWLPLSAQTFQVLSLIAVLHALFYFNSAVMLAAGKPNWRLGISVLNAVTNVTAFAIVVQYGIVAVAAAYVVRGYVLAPLSLVLMRWLIGIEWGTYLVAFVAPLVSTLAMLAAVLSARWALLDLVSPPVVLLACVPLGALTYTLTLWLIAPKRVQQIRRLVSKVIPSLA